MTIHPVMLATLLVDATHDGVQVAGRRHALGRFNLVGRFPGDTALPQQDTASMELPNPGLLEPHGLSADMVCWSLLEAERVRVTMGRDTACALRVADASLGRRHADLWVDDAGLWLVDLGSKAGTWRGDSRLPTEDPVRIQDGDVLRVGASTYTVFDGARLLGILAPSRP